MKKLVFSTGGVSTMGESEQLLERGVNQVSYLSGEFEKHLPISPQSTIILVPNLNRYKKCGLILTRRLGLKYTILTETLWTETHCIVRNYLSAVLYLKRYIDEHKPEVLILFILPEYSDSLPRFLSQALTQDLIIPHNEKLAIGEAFVVDISAKTYQRIENIY